MSTRPDGLGPLVSVYMPTRNRAALARRAIDSVLAQDLTDFELIVLNDASADDTAAVLRELAERDSRIQVHRHAQPRGAPAARNTALRAARGLYATGLDDDDEMLPHRLSSLLRAFDERHAFVCSDAVHRHSGWSRVPRASQAELTLEQQLYGNQAGSQVFALRERLLAVGGFDESMPAWQDYDLWTRMIERYGPALRIAEPSYVVHVGAAARHVSDHGAAGARRFIEKHGARMHESQRQAQLFEGFMLEGQRLRLADLARFSGSRRWRDLGRYFLSSNLPQLRAIAEAGRRLRTRLGRSTQR